MVVIFKLHSKEKKNVLGMEAFVENKVTAGMFLLFFGCTLTVVLTVLAFHPFLNQVFAVDIKQKNAVEAETAPVLEAPAELLVTAIYEREDNSKKISAIYIEVFHVGSNTVSYVEVPVDAKVTISEKLYNSLQTYAPELPQYLKLANMTENFSNEYALTAANRILSEALGVSLSEYICADRQQLTEWFALIQEKTPATAFFEGYTTWLEHSQSTLLLEERWMYYESWKQITSVELETVPGTQNKDDYQISEKRSKERLQELMSRSTEKSQE